MINNDMNEFLGILERLTDAEASSYKSAYRMALEELEDFATDHEELVEEIRGMDYWEIKAYVEWRRAA